LFIVDEGYTAAAAAAAITTTTTTTITTTTATTTTLLCLKKGPFCLRSYLLVMITDVNAF